MTAPHAILLVPTEAGVALRMTGCCGSSPPMVHRSRPDGTWTTRGDWCDTDISALPIWWAGALVPEGWDRARRVWGSVDTLRRLSAGYGAMRSADLDVSLPSAGRAVNLARALEAGGLCRVVLLDGRLERAT